MTELLLQTGSEVQQGCRRGKLLLVMKCGSGNFVLGKFPNLSCAFVTH